MIIQGGPHPRSPASQMDSLPAEPQGKPNNTGLGNLALLQGIFPTQELNWGLLDLQEDSLPTELSGKPKKGKCGYKRTTRGIL